MKFTAKPAAGARCRLDLSLILAFLLGVAGPASAATSTHSKLDVLTQASEIAEQISENASTIDVPTLSKSMSEFSRLDARLTTALAPDRKKALDALMAGIRSASAAGDRSAVGVESIEAYRLLQEALPRNPKGVPLEVAQLDYVGFKANALLASSAIDWTRIDHTVQEAQRWWAVIEPKTSDAMLKEGMTRTLLGMKEAADQKDAKAMHFAADMELILVDGLETHFLAHPRAR
jgi:hypothetical protein